MGRIMYCKKCFPDDQIAPTWLQDLEFSWQQEQSGRFKARTSCALCGKYIKWAPYEEWPTEIVAKYLGEQVI